MVCLSLLSLQCGCGVVKCSGGVVEIRLVVVLWGVVECSSGVVEIWFVVVLWGVIVQSAVQNE